MKFGTIMFPVSHNPERDGIVIDNALKEIELMEHLDFDAVWLTEHHFDGASAYADPVVFAAAVASLTSKIKIGFAVLELAFHHPVRLAAQTALLDNLSKGRLIVGLGRGSAFNHYEYIGFGLTMEEGLERLPEAEDLLIKAWTTKDLQYEGKFWKVAFPELRPKPFQKPHPPLVRACISEKSTVEMARIGRPILLGGVDVEVARSRLAVYESTMKEVGFGHNIIEDTLDKTWISKNLFVGESYSHAREIAEAGFVRERKHFREARELYNPGGFPVQEPNKPPPASEDFDKSFIIGTDSQVADQIAEMRDIGARNLMFKINIGELDTTDVQSSMRLFSQKVMPLFKDVYDT